MYPCLLSSRCSSVVQFGRHAQWCTLAAISWCSIARKMTNGAKKAGAVRYQSQRSRYLRIILDAEKEIARLEGLYESRADGGGEVVFRVVERREEQ